jgi:hypothetical protein
MLREGGRLGYRFGGRYQGSDPDTGSGGASKGPSGGGGGGGGGNGGNGGNGGGDDRRESYIRDYSSKQKVKGGGKGIGTDKGTGGPTVYEDRDFRDRKNRQIIERQRRNYEKQFFDRGQVPPLGGRPTSLGTKLNQRNLQKRLNYINSLQKQINAKLQRGLMDPSIPGIDVMTEEELLGLAPSVQDLVEKGFYSKDGKFATGEKIPDFNTLDMPGGLGILQDIFEGPVTSDKLKQLSGQLKTLEGLKTTEGLESDDAKFENLMKTYQPNRFEREFGDSRDDRDDDLILPTISTPADPATDPVNPRSNFYGLSPRIGGSIFDFTGLADGGRVAAAEGGIMELARQEMFLGGIAKGIKKGLKSATRAIKKVAKSPIGKAALLAAGGSFAKMMNLISRRIMQQID